MSQCRTSFKGGCLAFYPGHSQIWKTGQCWFLPLQGAGSLASPSSQSSHQALAPGRKQVCRAKYLSGPRSGF